MRRITPLVFASSLLLGMGVPALAHTVSRQPQLVATTFRLHVSGRLTPGTTFWVAYGPLDGHFAILRMRAVGNGSYVRSANLPRGARASYSYVMGHGVLRSRVGRVPGNPVVTIRSIGPVTVGQTPLHSVQWQAPIG